MNMDGPRNGDATTDRSINISFKESDVFGGGECGGEWVRTPCLRSIFWDLKAERQKVLQDVLIGVLVVVRSLPFAKLIW